MREKAGIYTKKGDQGNTSLGNDEVFSKSHDIVRAIGALEELNAQMGLFLAFGVTSLSERESKFLRSIQSDLFLLGTKIGKWDDVVLDQDRISLIEEKIDEVTAGLTKFNDFILPGGTLNSSFLHLLRTICRRAEREVVAICKEDDQKIIIYLNRLSDLFFVLAREKNDHGKKDICWSKESCQFNEITK